jgi:hypothetical protein
MRKKIEQEEGGTDNIFTQLFDKHFLADLSPSTQALSFREIYASSKKLNFFESTA